jgi:hypothetical protein
MKLTKSESARINGAESRGPKTARGRAFSSQSSTSHGLTARTLVLTNESRREFEQMLNSYQDFFQPSNPVELVLVPDMVAARWRLRRIWSYQSGPSRPGNGHPVRNSKRNSKNSTKKLVSQ